MNKAHLKILADDVQKSYQDLLGSIQNTNLFEKPLSTVQRKEVFVFVVDAYVSALSIPQHRTADYQNVMNTFVTLVMSSAIIDEELKEYFSKKIDQRTSQYSMALKGSDPILNLSNQLVKNIIESEGAAYDSNNYAKQIIGLSMVSGAMLVKIAEMAKLFYEHEKQKANIKDDEIASPFGKFMLIVIGLIVLFSLIANS